MHSCGTCACLAIRYISRPKRLSVGKAFWGHGREISCYNMTLGTFFYITLYGVGSERPASHLDRFLGLAVREWERASRWGELGGRKAWISRLVVFQRLPHSSIRVPRDGGVGWSFSRPQPSFRQIGWENLQESNEVKSHAV